MTPGQHAVGPGACPRPERRWGCTWGFPYPTLLLLAGVALSEPHLPIHTLGGARETWLVLSWQTLKYCAHGRGWGTGLTALDLCPALPPPCSEMGI